MGVVGWPLGRWRLERLLPQRITRRHVIGGALVAGAGVTAARLLGADRKVGTDDPYLYWQNLTWRKMALADLGSMLMQVTTDPAMMVYLDLAKSTGRNPNENYSRELLELFTMGAGAFDEGDVRAAAR